MLLHQSEVRCLLEVTCLWAAGALQQHVQVAREDLSEGGMLLPFRVRLGAHPYILQPRDGRRQSQCPLRHCLAVQPHGQCHQMPVLLLRRVDDV